MRMTRAAMRAAAQDDDMAIHEDEDASQQDSLQSEQEEDRPVLKDITDENPSTIEIEIEMKPAQPAKAKGKKKGRAAKKGAEELVKSAQTTHAEAIHLPVDTESSPVPESVLLQASEKVEVPEAIPVAEAVTPTPAAEIEADQTRTPQKELVTMPKTPKFNPVIHVPAQATSDNATPDKDDSFVESIKSRSPSKLSRESAEPDSFVEAITSRTPVAHALRIEDSVQAMDELEDAIEQISTSWPKIEHLQAKSPPRVQKPSSPNSQTPAKTSPVRKQSPVKAATPAVRKTAMDTTIATKTPKSVRPSPSKTLPVQQKKDPSRTDSGRISTVKPSTRAPVVPKSTSRPSTIAPKPAQRPTTEPESRPTMTFSNSPLKQQPNATKKRVTSGPLSTSKPGFVPAKSAKPPTTSTFALPGEAISAKLKAQREERAKKEAEEAKKPTFKARPAPQKSSRPSVVPRENKASQARTSAIRSGSNKENITPRPIPSTISKPTTNVVNPKTRPDPNKANSSVRRTTAAPRASLAPRIASQSAGEKLTITKEEAAQQKLKGREVFGRAKAEKEAMEKEKREKEDAAKKARAEAAERGRQASREWAERQKRKAEAAKLGKTEVAAPAGAAAGGPQVVDASV